MDEMVIDAYPGDQDAIREDSLLGSSFDGWDSICMFGIGATGDFGITTDQFALLGATFLRSAYVVYDLENGQLGLAQANLNSDEEAIVEITSGGLPDVTGVASQSPSASSTTTVSPSDTPDGGDNSSDDAGNDDDESISNRTNTPLFALSSLVPLLAMTMIFL